MLACLQPFDGRTVEQYKYKINIEVYTHGWQIKGKTITGLNAWPLQSIQSCFEWSPLSYDLSIFIFILKWCESYAMAFTVTRSQPNWTPMGDFGLTC